MMASPCPLCPHFGSSFLSTRSSNDTHTFLVFSQYRHAEGGGIIGSVVHRDRVRRVAAGAFRTRHFQLHLVVTKVFEAGYGAAVALVVAVYAALAAQNSLLAIKRLFDQPYSPYSPALHSHWRHAGQFHYLEQVALGDLLLNTRLEAKRFVR